VEGRFFPLESRPGWTVTTLTAVQWLMFMLTSVVTVPVVLAYLLDNGLIVGVILVLLLEHVLLRRRTEPHSLAHQGWPVLC
jgi:hypothetical protein